MSLNRYSILESNYSVVRNALRMTRSFPYHLHIVFGGIFSLSSIITLGLAAATNFRFMLQDPTQFKK